KNGREQRGRGDTGEDTATTRRNRVRHADSVAYTTQTTPTCGRGILRSLQVVGSDHFTVLCFANGAKPDVQEELLGPTLAGLPNDGEPVDTTTLRFGNERLNRKGSHSLAL